MNAPDWHPADIVAALRKAGWSVRKLSAHHGYAGPSALSNAIQKPWPKGERLIADAIGVSPEQIWPSRYAERAARKSAPVRPRPLPESLGANARARQGGV